MGAEERGAGRLAGDLEVLLGEKPLRLFARELFVLPESLKICTQEKAHAGAPRGACAVRRFVYHGAGRGPPGPAGRRPGGGIRPGAGDGLRRRDGGGPVPVRPAMPSRAFSSKVMRDARPGLDWANFTAASTLRMKRARNT